jgi:hypothetical protein
MTIFDIALGLSITILSSYIVPFKPYKQFCVIFAYCLSLYLGFLIGGGVL